jgi:hypothetical protein
MTSAPPSTRERRLPRTIRPRLALIHSPLRDDNDTLDERLSKPVLTGANGAWLGLGEGSHAQRTSRHWAQA